MSEDIQLKDKLVTELSSFMMRLEIVSVCTSVLSQSLMDSSNFTPQYTNYLSSMLSVSEIEGIKVKTYGQSDNQKQSRSIRNQQKILPNAPTFPRSR